MEMPSTFQINDLYSIVKSKGFDLSNYTLIKILKGLRKEQKIEFFKIGNCFSYPEQALDVLVMTLTQNNYHLDPAIMLTEYCTLTEAAAKLVKTPYTRSTIESMCLGISILYKGVIRVPISYIDELTMDDITNYISATDLEKQLGAPEGYIYQKIKRGHFKDFKLIARHTYISLEEVERLKMEAFSPHQEYTNKDAILNMDTFLSTASIKIPIHSHQLFRTWIISKIAKSHGRPTTLMHLLTYGKQVYNLLNDLLIEGKEIFNIESQLIEDILEKDSITHRTKKEFILFYNYAIASALVITEKRYRLERKNRKKKQLDNLEKEKKIYNPTIYQKYYFYVQNIDLHLENAIKKRHYANMWLFVIMHLTNNWRSNDIIYQLPNVSIELIGIDSFEWFKTNRLNTTQAQLIANEVYLHFQNRIANKNLAPLHFYLDPTLLMCFSTSLVLCELHSRKPNKSLKKYNTNLLASFVSGKKNEFVFSSGARAHMGFFGEEEDLFDFSSLVMNRSTMVYFFHNVLEGITTDADLALDLTQNTRSHFKKETTAIYVESSNQDGSVNRVSLNLFNRGHFGWVYNYIILLLQDSKPNNQSLEKRTTLIQEFRNKYNSLQIERWAEYLNLKAEHKGPLVIKLSQMAHEDLVYLLYQVFRGTMPSKHSEGQCLLYPKCIHPRRKTCFGCDYFIPKEFILIEAVSELKNRITLLHDSDYEAEIIRENKFINSILLLLSEAVEHLGWEKVDAFISKHELHTLLGKVSNKLHIT
ncbi:hypothetical protein [Paenibacillus cymbidii]|uniref:hypothetical protein n=1 Tax=Paenibacillus cymbidii TaxID=1639034 RepID=UPI001081FDA1|nr:hypothetical protein [Paenibacillus cymbidii]